MGFIFVCVLSLCRLFPLVFIVRLTFAVSPSGGKTNLISSLRFAQVADEYVFSLEENKKSKGRRQPLSKLPRHHPLVLQDCVSDDGECCLLSSLGELGLGLTGHREAKLRAAGRPLA